MTMTYDEAVSVRARQLQGKPVTGEEVAEAIGVIKSVRPIRRLPKPGPKARYELPPLPERDKQLSNSLLLLKLGIALGRLECIKAAA